jgi:YVTN family beta-propeller protein
MKTTIRTNRGNRKVCFMKTTQQKMFCFPKRLVLGLICWLNALFIANNAHAAFGDLVMQYSFPASSLVMNPTQALMYATIPSQNSIAIINTNTLAVEHTVFVGSRPANLAFSPDGSKAYIANSTSNFVVVFNTQTRTIVNSFHLSEHPQDVVFGSLNRLWVLGQTQIFQIDATTGASTGPSIGNNDNVFIYSGSLEISPERNTLYYGDYGLSPSTMYKLNVSGTTPVLVRRTPFGTVGSNGEDLTLSHNGNFICYTTGSGQNNYDIAKFRTSDFASLGSFYTGPYPQALAFSPDDSVVYASVNTASGIKVFNANTFNLLGTISGPDVATRLAVDSTGRYLFAGYTPFSLGTRVYDTGRAPYAPPVTTNPATFIGSFTGTLNGSLNPRGLIATFHFQYGTTTSYGLTTAPHTQTGNRSRPVGAHITSLTASTTYHFRIVASNADGTRVGSDRTFTTLTMTGPPVVITNPATNVTASSATLHGALDPHGLTTTVYFQYGTTTSYGHAIDPQLRTGNTYQSVSANISGLSASTTYHFRIVASNSTGTRFGSDRTFTTP